MNTRVERARDGTRERGAEIRGSFLFIRHALFFLDPSTPALDGQAIRKCDFAPGT